MKLLLFSLVLIGIFISGCCVREDGISIFCDEYSFKEIKQHNLKYSNENEKVIQEQIISQCKMSCETFNYGYNTYKFEKSFENNIYTYEDIICVCVVSE